MDQHQQEELQSSRDPGGLSRNTSFSKLNAQAPEFVPSPRSDLPPQPQPQPQPQGVLQVYHSPAPPPFHVPMRTHHVPVLPLQSHPHPHHLPLHYHPPPPPPPPPPQQHQHHHHFYGGVAAAFTDQHQSPYPQQPPPKPSDHSAPSKNNKLSDDATLKLLNQVEYYFSDLNLATTDHLMRFINKDPEGFVPISVVASFKKIKALINSHAQLATVLCNSSKLVVSDDGKKVRRLHPLTDSDMEELQSRIIVAENLPEDHCHQNLMKVFSSVGSVKTIRTCQPQTPNGGAPSASSCPKIVGFVEGSRLELEPAKWFASWIPKLKRERDKLQFFDFDRKITKHFVQLHAFVEYESVELAEKAVAELNDEGNWRSGLRVRLMVKRTSKPSQVWGRKGHDGDMQGEEDDVCTAEPPANGKQLEDVSRQLDAPSQEHQGEEHVNDKEGGQKKGRNRGRGKGRGRGHYHHSNRGNNVVGTPPSNNNLVGMEAGVAKQQPPGPRMPDGTRGFAMGRGKPVAVNITY